MKVALVLLILVGVGFVVMKYTKSGIDEGFDPTEQGRQVRETITTCTDWTEVLDRTKPPQKWRGGTSNFDFRYTERFDDTTRESIAKQLENNELPYGFSFFYRFSDAVTFAVNFDAQGSFSNIQDKEGKSALMDAAGG
ncbi:MAG: hypothetical protein IIB61_09105 [Planctomycetes bacterium]|nr:hypothetical protein [Planctomycetota bacterium]